MIEGSYSSLTNTGLAGGEAGIGLAPLLDLLDS